MANPWAGEVALAVDGVPRVMKLTLGALAELEAGLDRQPGGAGRAVRGRRVFRPRRAGAGGGRAAGRRLARLRARGLLAGRDRRRARWRRRGRRRSCWRAPSRCRASEGACGGGGGGAAPAAAREESRSGAGLRPGFGAARRAAESRRAGHGGSAVADGRRFDWPGLMRAGMRGLGLRPAEFWALTPAELRLMLGEERAAGDGRGAAFEELAGGLAGSEGGEGDGGFRGARQLDARLGALEATLGGAARMTADVRGGAGADAGDGAGHRPRRGGAVGRHQPRAAAGLRRAGVRRREAVGRAEDGGAGRWSMPPMPRRSGR